jgi:hypothetical protein
MTDQWLDRWMRLKLSLRDRNKSIRKELAETRKRRYRIDYDAVPEIRERIDSWETVLRAIDYILSEMARLEKEEE